MKNIGKFLSLMCIALTPVISLAQSGNYSINGKVAPLPSTAKAYLVYQNTKGRQIDSTVIINGSFSFSGTVESATMTYVAVNRSGTGLDNKTGYIIMYLEPAILTVTSPDSINNAKVTGGTVNADNEKLNAALAPAVQKMDDLKKEYLSASAEQRQSKDFNEAINKRADIVTAEQKQILVSFVKANPNSIMSLFTLKTIGGNIPEYTEVQPLFITLSPAVRSSALGVAYAADLAKMKVTAIGAVAPDFTMPDTTGNPVSLHDFKGKYVLVDFWASWCGPCRAENPNVVAEYALYKNKGFNILGVSLDQPGTKVKWLKAIHDDHLSWAQVSDLQFWKSAAAQLYSVRAIPQNFLIGPDGKIIAKNLRGDELKRQLAALFNKSKSI